jgi:hypothetical protein
MKRYIFGSVLFFISAISYASEQKPSASLDSIIQRQALQNSKKREEKKFCLESLRGQFPPIIPLYINLKPHSGEWIDMSYVQTESTEKDKTLFRNYAKPCFASPTMRCISQESSKKLQDVKNNGGLVIPLKYRSDLNCNGGFRHNSYIGQKNEKELGKKITKIMIDLVKEIMEDRETSENYKTWPFWVDPDDID